MIESSRSVPGPGGVAGGLAGGFRGLVLTCEHGGHRVPADLRSVVAASERFLRTHRGWDAGALEWVRALGRRVGAAPIAHTVSRLVVDPNRSEDHPAAFSSWTRRLDPAERERLLARYHRPHRERVERAIRAATAPVLHLGVHSFTPVFRGTRRRTDFSVLFDPARRLERDAASRLLGAVGDAFPEWTVRRNDPYRGTSDGLTTFLRGRFGPRDYAGLELELNQRHVRSKRWPRTRSRLAEALARGIRG